MGQPFRIAITRDVLGPDGQPWFPDLGLDLLDAHPGVSCDILGEETAELDPEVFDSYDGVLLLAPRVTAASVGEAPRTSVVARFGVGYDNVDVDASRLLARASRP